ncbi:MAG: imidazole glycerol phosphate synthase subunit HisF [Candidatus Saccharimonadales bacterium]
MNNAGLRRVIPCLDVKDGRVVKGEQFANLQDAGDPVALARQYEAEGADSLVFLDISATNEKRDTMVEWVRRVSEEIFIPFTVGGGVRSVQDVETLSLNGVESIAVNSAALERPKLLSELFSLLGDQNLVLAIDAKQSEDGKTWEAYTAGGTKPTGKDVVEWAVEGAERGAGEILLTSIDQDGRNNGYDIELTRAVAKAAKIPIIASGGAGRLEHFSQAFLEGNASAVLCAGTLHRGELSIPQIKAHLAEQGIPVRSIAGMELLSMHQKPRG